MDICLCANHQATCSCADGMGRPRLGEPQHTDQAMAVTTVTTAMQVVNAKATAKIAAIFFMIAFPRLRR